MTLTSLLKSLTNNERDFIAQLDYRQDSDQHRSALDDVISADGLVDFEAMGCWCPYEVIELGKNWLQEGHEREYAACLGVVLLNIERGTDTTNELEWIIENQSDAISQLPSELKTMITEFADRIITKRTRRRS